ncbi:DUF4253 domain-containing protein [Streptomyces sp. V1I6]|uniref:DUF4253 domain-containing protein n=1 Tax=Streptomyces sp. V1I6 TaxID=3042273 RepID=UPI00277E2134|nr:DUF4253 domain-containing protein [Streptomyces sp. V1I6]MDQ0840413.1 hypothetical protein [Streptomyces sp. V1I6]
MSSDHITEVLRTAGFTVPRASLEEARSRCGARVLGRRITESGAESLWRSLLAARESMGFHPLLSSMPPSVLVAGQLAEADLFDERAVTAPREIVAEITEAALADCLRYAEEEAEEEQWQADFDPERLAREISSEPESGRITSFRPDWLCLVESETGWAVPGLLPGHPYAPSWTHGPEGRPMLDSDHSAFLHTWHDRFEAELLYVSDRALMLDVARPPQQRLAVAEAAIEQFAYCPDGQDTTSWANRWTRSGTWQFLWD